jgi:hypothetical protein
MKRIDRIFALCLLMTITLAAAAWCADSPKAGMSLAQFEALWASEGKTPEGSVRCLLIAALETVKENNREGRKMWGMVLPKNYVDGKGEPDQTQRLAIDQFSRQVKGTSFKGGIAASYLGGTPENGYTYSYGNKVEVDARQSRIGDEEAKLFVRSGGKDNPSPVILKKNKDGYWKIFEYSSLFTGVKPIKSNDF